MTYNAVTEKNEKGVFQVDDWVQALLRIDIDRDHQFYPLDELFPSSASSLSDIDPFFESFPVIFKFTLKQIDGLLR